MKPSVRFTWVLPGLLAGWLTYEALPSDPRGDRLNGYDGLVGEVRRTRGLAVQFWKDGQLYATRDKEVFLSRDQGLSWHSVATLELAREGILDLLQDWFGRSKLGRRLRDACGIHLHPANDGTLIGMFRGVYRGAPAGGETITLHRTHEGPPFLSTGWAEDGHGVTYFGEYQLGNHAVSRLYWSRDGGESWTVRHIFPRTEIEHIHSVMYDPFRQFLWVTTGDTDHESRILYSADQGATFHQLGGGDQEWRAVSVEITENAIYWGTDDPAGHNTVFRWDWTTGQRARLLTVRNPFYYSTQDRRGNLYFSTAAEEQIHGGERFAELWRIAQEDRAPQRVVRWERGQRKRYPSGMVMLARGAPPDGWIALTPINLEGHHCETIVFRTSQ
jgi:hypothetical protein